MTLGVFQLMPGITKELSSIAHPSRLWIKSSSQPQDLRYTSAIGPEPMSIGDHGGKHGTWA